MSVQLQQTAWWYRLVRPDGVTERWSHCSPTIAAKIADQRELQASGYRWELRLCSLAELLAPVIAETFAFPDHVRCIAPIPELPIEILWPPPA